MSMKHCIIHDRVAVSVLGLEELRSLVGGHEPDHLLQHLEAHLFVCVPDSEMQRSAAGLDRLRHRQARHRIRAQAFELRSQPVQRPVHHSIMQRRVAVPVLDLEEFAALVQGHEAEDLVQHPGAHVFVFDLARVVERGARILFALRHRQQRLDVRAHHRQRRPQRYQRPDLHCQVQRRDASLGSLELVLEHQRHRVQPPQKSQHIHNFCSLPLGTLGIGARPRARAHDRKVGHKLRLFVVASSKGEVVVCSLSTVIIPSV
mmetsp:Transcript_51598/g.121076  ORF Transcript_51598/g.121076 Transcript_51598/m.121076 type:complete len:260 (-) Transcript_51598:375-1154(-)